LNEHFKLSQIIKKKHQLFNHIYSLKKKIYSMNSVLTWSGFFNFAKLGGFSPREVGANRLFLTKKC